MLGSKIEELYAVERTVRSPSLLWRVILLATVPLSSGCGAPDCAIDEASYMSIGLCDGPVSPEGLLEFAATVRDERGLLVIGSLRTESEGAAPRVYPHTCSAGVCLSEARLRGDLVVHDTLGSIEVGVGEEVVVNAPSGRNPVFTSDELGAPLCLGEGWLPPSGHDLALCYNSGNFLMPRPGDEFVFFLGALTAEGSRDLRWIAQTVGVSVSGDGTQSGRDVGTYDLELP